MVSGFELTQSSAQTIYCIHRYFLTCVNTVLSNMAKNLMFQHLIQHYNSSIFL